MKLGPIFCNLKPFARWLFNNWKIILTGYEGQGENGNTKKEIVQKSIDEAPVLLHCESPLNAVNERKRATQRERSNVCYGEIYEKNKSWISQILVSVNYAANIQISEDARNNDNEKKNCL